MLLVLTNSSDLTADYLTSVLGRHHVQFIRLDTDTATSRAAVSYRLSDPVIFVENKSYTPVDISDVWYRRPEQLKDRRFEDSPDGRYALDEWAEALEGFLAHVAQPRWINHPSNNAMASHKLEQLTKASNLGFQVPDSLVTQDEEALRGFFERHKGRIVVKPLAAGHVRRSERELDSQIYTNRLRSHHLTDLADVACCPTFFQQYIDKRSDVRITVVDGVCHAVELIAVGPDGKQRCDIRHNNMSDVEYRKTTLPADVENSVLRLMEHYGLRFAALDMAVGVNGEWYFLEVNPNGQWAWLDLSGGMNIAESFVRSFLAS